MLYFCYFIKFLFFFVSFLKITSSLLILKATTSFGWEDFNINPYYWLQPKEYNNNNFLPYERKYILKPELESTIVNVEYTPRPFNIFHTKELHQNYVSNYPRIILPTDEITYIQGY